LRLRVAIIDNAGFGLDDGRDIFGKEVYFELLARINEEYLKMQSSEVCLIFLEE